MSSSRDQDNCSVGSNYFLSSRIQSLYYTRAKGRQSTSLSGAFLEASICQLSLRIHGSVCVAWPILVAAESRGCIFFLKNIASHTKIKFLVNLGKKATRVFIALHDGDFYIVALWSEFPCKAVPGIDTAHPSCLFLFLLSIGSL